MTVGVSNGSNGALTDDSISTNGQMTTPTAGTGSVAEENQGASPLGEDGAGLTADQSAQRLLEDNTQLIKTITDSQQQGKAQDVFHLYQALHRNLLQLAQLTEPGNTEIPHLLPAPDPNVFSATLKPPSTTLMATVPPPQNYVPPAAPSGAQAPAQAAMITSRGGKPANIVNPYSRRPPPPAEVHKVPNESSTMHHHHNQHASPNRPQQGSSKEKKQHQQGSGGSDGQKPNVNVAPQMAPPPTPHQVENAVVIPVPKPVPASTVLSSMELQPQPVKQESTGHQAPPPPNTIAPITYQAQSHQAQVSTGEIPPPSSSMPPPNTTAQQQPLSKGLPQQPGIPNMQSMPAPSGNENSTSPRMYPGVDQQQQQSAQNQNTVVAAAPVSPAVTKFTAPSHVDPYKPLSAHTQSVLSSVSTASNSPGGSGGNGMNTSRNEPSPSNSNSMTGDTQSSLAQASDIAPNVNVTDALKKEAAKCNPQLQPIPHSSPQHPNALPTNVSAHQMSSQYPGNQVGPRQAMNPGPPPQGPGNVKYGPSSQHPPPPHSGASNPYYNQPMPAQQISPGSAGSYPGYSSHGMPGQGAQYGVPITQRTNPYAQQYPRYPGQPYPGMYGSGHSYPPAHYASPGHYGPPPPSQYPPGSQYPPQYAPPPHHMQPQQQMKMYHHSPGQPASSMAGHPPSSMPNANVTVHPVSAAGQPIPPPQASGMGNSGSPYHGNHPYNPQQTTATQPPNQQASSQHNPQGPSQMTAAYPNPQSGETPQHHPAGPYSMPPPPHSQMYARQGGPPPQQVATQQHPQGYQQQQPPMSASQQSMMSSQHQKMPSVQGGNHPSAEPMTNNGNGIPPGHSMMPPSSTPHSEAQQ
ncbi:uncharacterized protein LOC142353906 isoform X2 [Convolutriloba macropyga]|uniref:uncharacterized protein LOC142353906 isoform X2 n=1 Tax=Convolutriloba macropyga TaxID=536237 RepID=UPI003F51CE27